MGRKHFMMGLGLSFTGFLKNVKPRLESHGLTIRLVGPSSYEGKKIVIVCLEGGGDLFDKVNSSLVEAGENADSEDGINYMDVAARVGEYAGIFEEITEREFLRRYNEFIEQ